MICPYIINISLLVGAIILWGLMWPLIENQLKIRGSLIRTVQIWPLFKQFSRNPRLSVIYVVDLRRAEYYQKCDHDPECTGYRSPFCPLSEEIVPDTTICFKNVKYDQTEKFNVEYNSISSVDHCMIDGWWLEAIKFAEEVEKKSRNYDKVS